MFCLFGDTLSFVMFSSFSSAVLLVYNQTRSICATPIAFFERGDLERTRHLHTGRVTRFKMAEDICTIFSLPSLSTFVQRSHKIYE